MLRRCPTALVSAVLVAACGDNESFFDYPLDDSLTLNHMQAVGTHNSYHIASDPPATVDWNYTHEPLRIQARDLGVRQFELDLNINYLERRFEVFHFFRADEGTTCRLFVDCLEELKNWSDDNPAHHALAVMLELKDGFSEDIADEFFAILEDEITSVWPRSRLITPDLVRGEHASLRDAVAARGWPSLGESRGSIFFFLLAAEEFRDHYTSGGTTLEGRVIFVLGGPDEPFAAIDHHDDPIAEAGAIRISLDAGLLVRTRIDSVADEGPRFDRDKLEAAIRGGAHFLSTDEPAADRVGGTPSRCNPVLAPADCTDLAIEDPAYLQ